MVKKLFLSFFIAQFITYVTTLIGMTVDGIVTGSFLGEAALSAYGLITPVLTVLTAIGSAISVGTSTLLSAKLGKGDIEGMNRDFNVCFWATLIVSVIIAAVMFVFAGPIATMLRASGDVHTLVVQYLRGYSPGFPMIFLVVLSIPVMQLIGKRRTLITAIVVMTAVNIFMDFFNALVWHKEMLGMALATTISYILAFFIVMTAIVSRTGMLHLSAPGLDRGIIREMTAYGAPNAISLGSRNILTILINQLILNISGMAMIAGFAAVMSAMQLGMSVGIGMASAVSMLTGVFSGEKDRLGLVDVVRVSFRYSVIVNAACSLILIIFARPIVSLFIKNVSVTDDAATGLRIMSLCLIFFSINYCIRSYYQAMKIKITIPYAVFNCLIGTAVIAFILGNAIGIMGVWLAYPLGEMATLILFGAYALRKRPDKNFSMLERFMLIPEEYYGDVEPVEYDVKTIEDTVRTSEAVQQYMLENGSGKRTAMYSALAAEELVGNVILHDFDEKKNTVILKLGKDGDDWILRIRDNCHSFDPVAYVRGITPEQAGSHYGIRMIYGLADEVKYLNTLNMNNLLIRFSEKTS